MTDAQIRRLLKDFTQAPVQVKAGTVTEVDEDAQTCTVKPVDGAELLDVRLKANIDEDEETCINIPAVDSTVLVGAIHNDPDTTFIAMTSKVSKVIKKINDQTYEMTDQSHVFNGGDNGGLIIIADLINQLNAIENKINTFLNAYNAHTHPDPSSGSTGPANNAGTVTTLTNTSATDIENDKVKH